MVQRPAPDRVADGSEACGQVVPVYGFLSDFSRRPERVVGIDDQPGEQLVPAPEVAVQGRGGHAEVPRYGPQAQRGRAVGRQVTAGRVQDFRGDLRPDPFPGRARRRRAVAGRTRRPAPFTVAGLVFRLAHPPIMTRNEIGDNNRDHRS